MVALKARRVFRDERRTVIVVESVELWSEKWGKNWNRGFGVVAELEPVAIVIMVGELTHAMDVNATSMDLEPLLQDAAELRGLLGQ